MLTYSYLKPATSYFTIATAKLIKVRHRNLTEKRDLLLFFQSSQQPTTVTFIYLEFSRGVTFHHHKALKQQLTLQEHYKTWGKDAAVTFLSLIWKKFPQTKLHMHIDRNTKVVIIRLCVISSPVENVLFHCLLCVGGFM